MIRVKKRKCVTWKMKLLAGDWDIALWTKEGERYPLFRTFQDRLRLLRNTEVRIALRRIR